jgi:hypothetical protein
MSERKRGVEYSEEGRAMRDGWREIGGKRGAKIQRLFHREDYYRAYKSSPSLPPCSVSSQPLSRSTHAPALPLSARSATPEPQSR